MFLILSRATKQQQLWLLAKGEYFVDNSEKNLGFLIKVIFFKTMFTLLAAAVSLLPNTLSKASNNLIEIQRS